MLHKFSRNSCLCCKSEFPSQWSRNRYWLSCYCKHFFKAAGNITDLKRMILLFLVPLATVLLNTADFCRFRLLPFPSHWRHNRDILHKLKYFISPCV
jgi:hypothetical protein